MELLCLRHDMHCGHRFIHVGDVLAQSPLGQIAKFGSKRRRQSDHKLASEPRASFFIAGISHWPASLQKFFSSIRCDLVLPVNDACVNGMFWLPMHVASSACTGCATISVLSRSGGQYSLSSAPGVSVRSTALLQLQESSLSQPTGQGQPHLTASTLYTSALCLQFFLYLALSSPKVLYWAFWGHVKVCTLYPSNFTCDLFLYLVSFVHWFRFALQWALASAFLLQLPYKNCSLSAILCRILYTNTIIIVYRSVELGLCLYE